MALFSIIMTRSSYGFLGRKSKMAMLSKEEAVYFVSHVLEISSPLEKIAQDSYHFLKEYMSAFHVNIPFQTITSMAIEPHLRHRSVHAGRAIASYLTVFCELSIMIPFHSIIKGPILHQTSIATHPLVKLIEWRKLVLASTYGLEICMAIPKLFCYQFSGSEYFQYFGRTH